MLGHMYEWVIINYLRAKIIQDSVSLDLKHFTLTSIADVLISQCALQNV